MIKSANVSRTSTSITSTKNRAWCMLTIAIIYLSQHNFQASKDSQRRVEAAPGYGAIFPVMTHHLA